MCDFKCLFFPSKYNRKQPPPKPQISLGSGFSSISSGSPVDRDGRRNLQNGIDVDCACVRGAVKYIVHTEEMLQ